MEILMYIKKLKTRVSAYNHHTDQINVHSHWQKTTHPAHTAEKSVFINDLQKAKHETI